MKSRPPVGAKVVFNQSLSAIVFEVTKLAHCKTQLWVREAGCPHHNEALVDQSICMEPSAEQLDKLEAV